jgi:hypothetical protein
VLTRIGHLSREDGGICLLRVSLALVRHWKIHIGNSTVRSVNRN